MAESMRERIVKAAVALFYTRGFHAVGVDLIAREVGVTKRTLYYHFASKDDIAAAYLEDRDQPIFEGLQRRFARSKGDIGQRTRAMFVSLAKEAKLHQWQGCGFLRAAAELVDSPFHPATSVASGHKKRFESWMAETFEFEGLRDGPALARQVALLMDGAQALAHLHRDPAYIDDAGQAAERLLRGAIAGAVRPSATV